MATLDIFKADAFSMVTLTAAVNKMPFVPGRAGRLGIFEEGGVATTTVSIEERAGTLALVPDTPRGAPSTQNTTEKRVDRPFRVPHFPLEDSIRADEVQNVRAFGKETELESVQSVVNAKLMRMNTALDATVEYGRIGAIKGIIYDANGSTVIYNLFTEFGVSQTTVDYLLGTTTTDILGKCIEVAGDIEDELGAAVYDHIHVFCGKTWFQRFVSHTAVKDAYKYFQATNQTTNPLRDDLRYGGFKFGGLTFEQYRGSVGGVGFVADSEAHAFPVGVPGLFISRFSPADYMEAVNTNGLPRYAKVVPDGRFNKAVALEAQTNPISLCLRPKVLIKLTTGN